MELSSLLFSFIFPLFSFLVLFYTFIFSKKPSTAAAGNAYPLIGHFLDFIKNGGRIIEWTAELIAGAPTGTCVLPPVVFTADPSVIEHILRTNFSNYVKGERTTSALHDFLGDGIFNVDGDLWLFQRKTASHEFNAKSIRAFVADSVRREALGRLVPFLSQAAADGRVVDLQNALEKFALDNVCMLVFGVDPGCLSVHDSHESEGMEFFHLFEEASDLSIRRMAFGVPIFWKLKKLFNVGSERRLKEAVKFVRDFCTKLLKEKKNGVTGGGGSDFMSRFIAKEELSDEILCDVLINFVMAGRDTTPSALTWFFFAIRDRPDVVDKILSEIKSVRAKSKREDREEVYSIEELREMHYLHAAISEGLRLYPPVPLQPKYVRAADVLPDGTHVRKGWSVLCSAWAMGRSEKLWGEDWAEIRPERWLDGDGKFTPASPYSFPVFGGGTRMCLGKDMAFVQMKAVVACVLERFEVFVTEEKREHQLSMTMRMKGGLPVRIKDRAKVCTTSV